MYAIISDGSRQYKVEEGAELTVDYRDVPVGQKVTFGDVLAVGGQGDMKLGSPLVKGASVTAEVLGPVQGEKHVIQKMRRRCMLWTRAFSARTRSAWYNRYMRLVGAGHGSTGRISDRTVIFRKGCMSHLRRR